MNEVEIHEKMQNFLFAKEQVPMKFPDPDFAYPLDEQGFRVKKKLPDEDLVIAYYWFKKKKQIALLGIISFAIPFSILVQETGIFDLIFINLVDFIFYLIGLVWGLIF